MGESGAVLQELQARFGAEACVPQPTCDGTPTLWVSKDRIREILRYLKTAADPPYRMLYDLTAVDERDRQHRQGQPASDFTVVYHLLSFGRNADVRLKVALTGEAPALQTVTDLWPAANWYEREVWDMFGVTFPGHPNLRRILMPPTWQGHPLRKDHPARATEMGQFRLPDDKQEAEQEALRFRPSGGCGAVPGTPSFCSSTSGRSTPGPTASSASSSSSTARRSSMRSPTSATTTAVPKKWESVSPGILISLTPTASTTSAGSRTTWRTSCR